MVEFLSKFQGRGIKIYRVNSIRDEKSIILIFNILNGILNGIVFLGTISFKWYFFNILNGIAPWVTSSWAIVFFALSLRLLPLVNILWLGPPSNSLYLPLSHCRHQANHALLWRPSTTTYCDRLVRNSIRTDSTGPPTPTEQSLKRINDGVFVCRDRLLFE